MDINKHTLTDNILSLTLSKLNVSSATRNEFLMMPYSIFLGKLSLDSHYKNKFYMILLCRNGFGKISIDNDEFELKTNTISFINYNQVYHFTDDNTIEGDVILFTKSFYNHVYTGNKIIKSDTALHDVAPTICLNPESLKDLTQTFIELTEEYKSKQASQKEILCLLLKVFMLKYIRNSDKNVLINRSVDHKKELVDNFIDLANRHYKELKTTSMYAEKLNLSPNYLNAVVKEKIDITAGQVIKNRITLEAERLLIHSTLSITEISYELGFSDNSHFGKYFKSAKGISPKSFRLLHTANH